MIRSHLLVALFFVLSLTAAANANTIYPVNNGFEAPNLGTGGYGYWTSNPYSLTGLPMLPSPPPGWTFTGTSGVTANGSGFGTTGATNGNHDGTTSTSGQAAFLQNGYGTPNTVSQLISGFVSGPASVTFSLEERGGNSASVDVKLDGTDLGTYTPLSGSSFNTVTTPTTFMTPGSHTLTFTGVNSASGGDNTVFIDNVRLTSVPEPASLITLALGAVGLLLAARRRKA
jgi:hypothetical protein